jgi:hypothetical protein
LTVVRSQDGRHPSDLQLQARHVKNNINLGDLDAADDCLSASPARRRDHAGYGTCLFPGENKNTVTFTINCGEFGTFTGTLPAGTGAPLHLEGGGLAISHG